MECSIIGEEKGICGLRCVTFTLSGFIQYKNKSNRDEGKGRNKIKRRERQEHSKDLIHVGRRREDSVFISNPTEAFHLDGFNTRDKCFDIFNVFFNDRNLIHGIVKKGHSIMERWQ
jgi:hypothetical protein